MPEVQLISSMEGPDGAPVIVLANAIGTTRAMWDAQARVLRGDFRLLRFELRGHGEPGARSAAPPGAYSIAELGGDVLGLMRDYGVTTAAYCGISLGGMIGQWLGAHAPDRLTALVLANTSARFPDPSLMETRRRTALESGMAPLEPAVMGRFSES